MATHRSGMPSSIRMLQTTSRCSTRFTASKVARFGTTAQRQHQTNTSSVDPTEVTHFNALASAWWDPHGSSRLLHLMNPMRHQFIKQCIASQPDALQPNQKLAYLDIGCGGGIFAESAARLRNTSTVTAIDPTPEVFKVAEAHKRRDPMLCEGNKLTYLNISIEDLSKNADAIKQYDIVSIFEVIEHVNRPSDFLHKVLPHVKPGGWLIMSTIARTWTSWLVTNVMAEDVLRIVPKGTHDWSKYIDEKELRGWFGKREGWETPRAMGVLYVPGIGWKEIPRGEDWGNYFFGIRKSPARNRCAKRLIRLYSRSPDSTKQQHIKPAERGRIISSLETFAIPEIQSLRRKPAQTKRHLRAHMYYVLFRSAAATDRSATNAQYYSIARTMEGFIDEVRLNEVTNPEIEFLFARFADEEAINTWRNNQMRLVMMHNARREVLRVFRLTVGMDAPVTDTKSRVVVVYERPEGQVSTDFVDGARIADWLVNEETYVNESKFMSVFMLKEGVDTSKVEEAIRRVPGDSLHIVHVVREYGKTNRTETPRGLEEAEKAAILEQTVPS